MHARVEVIGDPSALSPGEPRHERETGTSAEGFSFSLIEARIRIEAIHKKRRGFTRREDFRFEKVSRVRLDGIFIARPIFSRTGEFASVPTVHSLLPFPIHAISSLRRRDGFNALLIKRGEILSRFLIRAEGRRVQAKYHRARRGKKKFRKSKHASFHV